MNDSFFFSKSDKVRNVIRRFSGSIRLVDIIFDMKFVIHCERSKIIFLRLIPGTNSLSLRNIDQIAIASHSLFQPIESESTIALHYGKHWQRSRISNDQDTWTVPYNYHLQPGMEMRDSPHPRLRTVQTRYLILTANARKFHSHYSDECQHNLFRNNSILLSSICVTVM